MTIGKVKVSERLPNITEPFKRMMENYGVHLRVAMPGFIMSFDSSKQTVSVKLAIREKLSIGGLQYEDVQLPIIEDVPIFMPRAGNFVLTMPITIGDECLVIFGDNCIDSWWQSGQVGNQMDKRRHDLSDGFALLGVWSQPNVISNYSTDSAVLRNLNNNSLVEVKDTEINIITDSKVQVTSENVQVDASNVTVNATLANITATGAANIEGGTVSIEGGTVDIKGSSVMIDGNSTSTIDGKNFLHHTHTGVTTGINNTGEMA